MLEVYGFNINVQNRNVFISFNATVCTGIISYVHGMAEFDVCVFVCFALQQQQ